MDSSESFGLDPVIDVSETFRATFPATPECTCYICTICEGICNITNKLQNVIINVDVINEHANKIFQMIKKKNHGRDKYHPIAQNYIRHTFRPYSRIYDYMTLDLIFMLNALNFSLWSPKNLKQWTVNGKMGYYALCNAINKANDEGKPIWNPTYYSKITLEELTLILRSDDNETIIPHINKRVEVLHEIGTVLLNKYQGSFANCVELCNSDATKMLHLLFKEFKSFRDTVCYKEEEVCIGSKARMLLNDLYHFGKVSYADITSHYSFPAFYDYRTPHNLFCIGIFKFRNNFLTKIANDNAPLKESNREVLELRCATVRACILLMLKILQLCESYKEEMPELQEDKIAIFVNNYIKDIHFTHHGKRFIPLPDYHIRSIYY